MKTIKQSDQAKINQITANAKSVVTFTADTYFQGKALSTDAQKVAQLIQQAFKEGAKLQDKGNGEYRIMHSDNHWVEIKAAQ
jgi:hypothetical protein